MCVLYPMVAKVLRDSFKPSNTPGSKSCCGSMLNGTGHPDLDELLKSPLSLTFTFGNYSNHVIHQLTFMYSAYLE